MTTPRKKRAAAPKAGPARARPAKKAGAKAKAARPAPERKKGAKQPKEAGGPEAKRNRLAIATPTATPTQTAAPATTPAPEPAPEPAPTLHLPPADGDAPLHELSRDALSAFLYAALLPEEALALVKRFGITFPGFRPEKASEVERCDAIADEIRMRPAARQPVLEVLRAGLKAPAFPDAALDAVLADELLEVAGSDHGLAIALWRLVADPQPEIRGKGAAALERLAAEWYGPPPKGGEAQPPPPARPGKQGGSAGGEEAARALRALEERLARAEARAEQERQRGDQAREKLQAQLKEARAEAARAVDEAARARDAAEAAGAARRQAEVALAQARSTDAAAEAQRLRGALREAEVRLHAAEGELAKAQERLAALEARVAEASSAPAPAGAAAPAAPEGDEVEEAPATWLLPIFSDEFYRSLEGWDRRIQRAALKQAFLLSQDHRHPSLRALPLEGLPGYYRVRVATDVRLIYRRGERQDTVELCSLIDREDLDRYVRQAKTR